MLEMINVCFYETNMHCINKKHEKLDKNDNTMTIVLSKMDYFIASLSCTTYVTKLSFTIIIQKCIYMVSQLGFLQAGL